MVVINGVEQLPCIAQLHAHKQMHDICIARGSIISTRVAQTAKKTGYSADAHKQGHGLAVAIAVVKVAPAVPHAVHDELYLLVVGHVRCSASFEMSSTFMALHRRRSARV